MEQLALRKPMALLILHPFYTIPSFFSFRKSTSRSPRIPQELVDMVIDYLHNDRQALSACALVSHTWLPSARIHLFTSLMLTRTTDFPSLLGLLDQSPELAACVQTTTIYGDLPFSVGVEVYEWLEDALKVLSKLPSIRKLNWWAFDWGVVEDTLKKCTFTFPPVSELCADAVRFSSVENLALFFRTFSTVTSLALREIHVTGLDLSSMPLLFSHSPPRLRQLFLMSNGANGPLIDLLLLPHFEFDLRCLHTAWTPQLCLDNGFQTLCGVVASTVQELLIVIKCNPSEALIKCLRSFTQLRNLTLTLEIPKSDSNTLSHWLHSAISQLPPSQEQIILQFNESVHSLTEPDSLGNWKSIDDTLSDITRFRNLTNLSVGGCFCHRCLSRPIKPDQRALQIADCFPQLTKKGLTRVFTGDDGFRVLLFPP